MGRRGTRRGRERQQRLMAERQQPPPLRTRGALALADTDSAHIAAGVLPAALTQGVLGPNDGHLPRNMQTQAQNYQGWPNQFPSAKPYPEMPPVPDDKPLLDSIGATGVAIFSGIITSEEYNPDFYWRDAIKIYERMLRDDGQINAVREQMELPIRRATWSITPASDDEDDQEVASFVESCLFEDMCFETATGRTVHQHWDDTLRHILMHLWYGFMAFEVNWRVEDGWVKWARWTPLLPRTVWRWWVAEDNELVGIQQWTFRDYTYQFVNIPADKLLLFSRRMEGNNYEGVSALRTAYKHWWYKINFEKIEAIGIERNAVVPPVMYLPENPTQNDIHQAQTIVQNIRANEMGGITLPFGYDLMYPKNMQRYATQVQPSIQYHDVMIARNVLAQFLNLGSTETGAYNLNDSQLDSFRAALQGYAEYIEDVINNDAIPRLVDYNFEGVEVYPKLTCSKIQLQDMTRLAALLQQLQAYIPPSQELSDWLASELGIPVAPGSIVQTTNPTSPSNPARPDTQPDNHEDEESADTSNAGKTQEGPEDALGGGGGGADGGGAGMSEDASYALLLSESVATLERYDVVERGLTFTTGWQRDVRGRFVKRAQPEAVPV